MTKKKVVVALGHRSLGETLPQQKEATRKTARAIADLAEAGAELVISHSNAPQVGMIHTAMNEFGKAHQDYTYAPMSVCSAMSQGYIGYDLQNSIREELISRGIYKPVCTVLTQVKVDPYDDAFASPVKVIGRYMTKEEAEAEERKGNHVIKEDKGYRRIVAAPKPQDVIEVDSIKALQDAGHIVIACGGGGIPVLEQGAQLRGASAVIEKDYTSGKIAQLLDADELLILTSVEKVALDYRSESETWLDQLDPVQARAYIDAGQFGETTMRPKVEASVEFVEQKGGRKAVITSIDKAKEGYLGKTGTVIQ